MRWAAAWLLYWLGDNTARWLVGERDCWVNERTAGLYQWFMRRSIAAQGCGAGPWE